MTVHARRTAIVITTVSVLGLTAAGPSAARHADPKPHRTTFSTAGTGTPGFAVVHEVTGIKWDDKSPMPMAVAGPGDIWLASAYPGNPTPDVTVRHLKDGQWTTYTLPKEAWDTLARISATAADDIWLTTREMAYHSTGGAFTPVPLPYKAKVNNLVDVPGPEAYVGVVLSEYDPRNYSSQLLRWDGTAWQEVPGTAGGSALRQPYGAAFGSTPFFPWGDAVTAFTPTGPVKVGAHMQRTDGYWQGMVTVPDSETTATIYGYRGWVRPDGKYELYGEAHGSRPGAVDWPVTAAAQLPSGDNIVGGSDDHVLTSTPTGLPKQGGFAIHHPDGSGELLPGDPGGQTYTIGVEPGRMVAWALTRSNWTFYLQRMDLTATPASHR